jgi:hypothetical protein
MAVSFFKLYFKFLLKVRAAREEIQHVFVGAREIVRRGPPPAGYSNNNGVGHGHGGIVAKDDDDASVFTLGSVVDKMAGLDLPLPNQGQGQLRQQQKLSVSQDSIFDAEGRNGHHQNGAEKVAKSGVGGGKYGSPPLIAAGAKRTNSKTRGREEPNEDTTFRQPPLPPYNPAPTHQSGGSIDSAPSGGFGAVRRGRPTQAASPVKNGSNSSKALPANSNNAVAQQALAPPRPPPRQNGGGQKTNGYRIMAQNEGNGYRLVNENGDHNMAPAPTNGHRRVGSGNRAEDESDSDNTLHDEASVMVNGNCKSFFFILIYFIFSFQKII